MGYAHNDCMDFESCEELRADVIAYLKRHKIGVSRLAEQSGVRAETIKDFYKGKLVRIGKVNYGKLWLAVHPEK